MLNSMTGFAARTGSMGSWKWIWDIRSVNARGLDVRLRVPDWIEGLEIELRDTIRKNAQRGSISLGLRLTRDTTSDTDAGALPQAALDAILASIARIEMAATQNHDLTLAPTSAADVLQLLRRETTDDQLTTAQTKVLKTALLKDFTALLGDFQASRAAEGAKLTAIIKGQVDQIETLTHASAAIVGERAEGMARNFRDALERVTANSENLNLDRIHQEIATLAVKADVAEELDRLRAHIQAAHELIGSKKAVGRKLDFLTQEFNREANTLCSKSQWQDLTSLGLDLKATVDQMREQVQNVE